jgi:HPt (histidine-containing phosphotransfer) domain-containing protein
MTAHALQGDRERCFEAGMEDYLSKPVNVDALAEALARCVPLARAPEVADAEVADAAVDRAVLAGFAEQLGEAGEEVLREVVAVYLEDTPALIDAMRAAASTGDLDVLDRSAHTLKSSSAVVGAMELSALCQRLEADARGGAVPDAPGRVEAVASAFDRARLELDGLQATA